MKPQNKDSIVFAVLAFLTCSVTALSAPMGTTFTYQGRLLDDNVAADGLYDFEFTLHYSDPNGLLGIQLTLPVDDVQVIDGYFVTELDFGSGPFKGDARWLQIAVRPGESTDPGDYVTLDPPREITSTPYALYAETTGSDGDWIVSSDDMYSTVSGNVGIGTINPSYSLHVEGKSISGINSTANGAYATVSGGWGNDASNTSSTVSGGESNTASGIKSVVGGGSNNNATADHSTIPGGRDNIASGNFSTAMGLNSNAESFASVALGRFNIGGGNSTTWVATDPIFEVGIGTTSAARTNAVTVLKNGNVGIGTINPSYSLHVKGKSISGINSTANGAYATVSGGWGNDASNTSSTVSGGESNTASGIKSVVGGGSNNNATADHSTIPGGRDNIASGNFSTAMGLNANAESMVSVALGRFNVGGGTPDSWITTDPIFEIGIGTTSTARTNAMTVLKNGSVGVGIESPTEKLEVVGTVKATTFIGDGSGLTGISLSETDPQVGTISNNYVPKWNGSALSTGTIYDNGNIGIATANPAIDLAIGDTDTGLQQQGDGQLALYTNNVERVRVDSGGKVGIGKVPTYTLDVQGNRVQLTDATGDWIAMRTDGASADILDFSYGGGSLTVQGSSTTEHVLLNPASGAFVGVGTWVPSRRFFVNGEAGGTTAWYNDSDARLKKEIVTIDNALEKVSQLRGVQFEWNDSQDHAEGKQIGFIGQEAEKVVPEVVDVQDGSYSMQYAPLTALLVEAVKELKAENELLKKRIEILESVER